MHRTNPARPATAVLVLVWALAVPAAGGLISDVGAIPNPFSPNADGVFDSTAVYYSLSEQADVVISVADSAGIGFLTLWSGWEDEGTHGHWWDGWFEDSFVADGEYQFLIEAIPEFGPIEEAAFSFVVDTEAPPLLDVEVAPSRFSPDGDGVGDSLMISFLASSIVNTLRYGPRDISALNASITPSILASTGISFLVSPSGYPLPSKYS